MKIPDEGEGRREVTLADVYNEVITLSGLIQATNPKVSQQRDLESMAITLKRLSEETEKRLTEIEEELDTLKEKKSGEEAEF